VDVADLHLRFRSFFHGRIEKDKVPVFGFGLRQAVRAALPIPAVGDSQLGFGQKLALIVGIDQRIQSDPRHFKTPMLDVVDGLIKQHLVRLPGVL